MKLSKQGKLILLAGTVILLLVVVFGQLYVLSPLKSDLDMKKQTLASDQKLLEIMTQKKADDTAQVVEDTRELQKKVPVLPLQEQFILDLEKAENVSNSKILSMGFTKDAEAAPAAAEGTEAVSAEGSTTDQATAVSGDTATTGQQTEASATNGLKKLTVSLSVESPTYEDLEKFISALESLKRIVVVESITYSGGEEITTLEQEKEPISYSLTVSAYYLPTLDDLIAELPKIDAPAPAKKSNPLSTFSNTTSSAD